MEMIKSISIQNVVQKRDAAVERIKKISKLAEEVKELGYKVDICHDRYGSEFGESTIKQIDAETWDIIMTESGMMSFFDSETKKKWRESIDKKQVPDLSVENIESTFRDIYNRRGDMFEEGVINLFKKLKWCYKTNSPVRFGKKIIMSYACNYGFISSEACDKLSDLERVFNVVNGKPESDFRHSFYKKANGCDFPRKIKTMEFDYFHIKGFKNGNVHVIFKGNAPIDHLNKILVKHYPNALPPSEDEAR